MHTLIFRLLLISEAQSVKPRADGLLRIAVELLRRFAPDRDPVKHLSIRQSGLYRGVSTGRSAALVRVKWDYHLIAEIIAFHKGVNRHRQIAPPYRIAEEYNIIAVHIIHTAFDLRAGFVRKLFLRYITAIIIIGGIGRDRFDMKAVRAYLLRDIFR